MLTKFDKHIDINDSNVLFEYSGVCDMEHLHKEMESIRNNVEVSNGIRPSIKIFNVLVEMLQNLDNNAIGNVDVRVWSSNQEYIVATRNMISNNAIPEIEKKLVEINSLNRSELREWRKNVINNSEMKEGEGAGVGLIDIAIRSCNEVNYLFKKIDTKFSFFSLETKVSK